MPNIPNIQRICNSMIFGRKTSTAVEADQQWKGEKCLDTMRQSFHPALTTCSAPLPPGKKYVAVQFLTKELVFYVIDAKGKGLEVFEEAGKHIGLLDAELFGLAVYQDDEYIFLDLNIKISKYACRSWRTHIDGLGGDGQPLLILYMRVKYYVDCPLLINEKVVRHHYYLQLRENIRNYVQPVTEEKSFVLAALALQADLGNYNAEKHKNRYFAVTNYFPTWIVKKVGEDFISRHMPALHQDNAGLSRGEAQVGYIKEASDSTAPHNMHLYKMRRKRGKTWGDVWLGIGDGGLHIYEKGTDNTKCLLSTFMWCDIAKLHFEKKKFEILSEGCPEYRRFTYFVLNEELAKYLLWICRMTHFFHMSNQARVADLKKLELDGGKQYREAYIYTDKFDQVREKQQSTLQKNKASSTLNHNGNGVVQKSACTKMSGIVWNGCTQQNGQNISQHHSMEVLPLLNGYPFSSELKYKSQSIPCLPDRSLSAFPEIVEINCSSPPWSPPSDKSPTSTTPSSTLISHSSCTSNTDSTCSSLSCSSTLKVVSNDRNHWVKCDSFEELPLSSENHLQKMCISTFSDKHVRTASVYDAVLPKSIPKPNPPPSIEQTVPYTTSSLGTSASNKIVVKRSPSCNVCPVAKTNLVFQKPVRQFMANAQPVSSHGRTTTRIGVSSLSRDQRLPLTLFDDRKVLGSEPNLYSPLNEHNQDLAVLSLKTKWLQRHLNSQSEMCLNVLDGNLHSQQVSSPQRIRPPEGYDANSRQLSLPDVCSEVVDGVFPFIPPPPAYRNNAKDLDFVQKSLSQSQLNTLVTSNSAQVKSEAFPRNSALPRLSEKAAQKMLDFQQLRQRSRDLDLPLITALCNDRSLLMLPKTVPTCSRQRHLGNRTSSLPNGEGMDALLKTRPVSWHIDSAVPHWVGVPKPSSASWDYAVCSQYPLLEELAKPRALENSQSSLPPTILTSFVKTPVRQQKCVSSRSESYRFDTSQMIPMKLLATSLGNISHGRLAQKGCSS